MYYAFIDYEKTLINDKFDINIDDLNLLNNYLINNKMMIVSSESFNNLLEFKNKYNLNIDILSTTDSLIMINNELIYNHISKLIINDILNIYKDYIYTAYGSSINNSYVYKHVERLIPIYPKNYKIIDKIDEDIIEFSVVIDINKETDFINYLLLNKIEFKIYGKDKNRIIFNISNKIIDKSYGVKLIKNYYDSYISIGISDSIIDIDFINLCNIKIAMLNGDNELKNKVDYITKYDNNNGGAIKILNDICHRQ